MWSSNSIVGIYAKEFKQRWGVPQCRDLGLHVGGPGFNPLH